MSTSARQVTEWLDEDGKTVKARRTDEWFGLDKSHMLALERVLVVENSENLMRLGERGLVEQGAVQPAGAKAKK